MKKFFLLNFVFLLMLSSNLFSDLKFRIKEGDKIIEKTLPDGSNAVSITFKDSVIKTFYIGKNIKKDVIIEFETPPVKTYRGQKDFNFKENNRLIESVKLEQAKFYNDIERIIKNKSKLKDTTLQDAEYKVYFSYRIALNGIALHTTQWVIDEIQKLDYVKKVHEVVEVKINDDESNHVIRADSVWYNLGVTGEGVLIAIIDTGIDSNHVALNNGKVVGGYNFISDENDFFDDHGHGTHCAGIAAANGGGLTGVAPGASLMGIKVLDAGGGGFDFQIIAGIEYSLDPDGNPNTNDGVDIISMSIGGGGDPDDAMSTAVDNAVINGVLCAVAAGNNGSSYTTIESPGCARLAFTVGASDNYDNIADFSSRGPVNVTYDIKPDIVAPGVNVYSSMPYNSFESMSGTSMATPHIAGAAALLKELHPDWTPQELKSAFMGTAVDVGADIWSQGSGRVDVYKVAQTSSVLTPSSINFGFVDISQNIWTKSDTLQLYNYSNESKTYYLTLEHDFPEGFSYTIEPSTVNLSANSNTDIVVTISVDNDVFPISDNNPPVCVGKILAQTENEIVKTVFTVSKARLLFVEFDSDPTIVLIHNRNNFFYYSLQNPFCLVVPDTPLDVIGLYLENYSFTYVLKERVVTQDSANSISISYDEATNYVGCKFYDESVAKNHVHYNNYGYVQLKLKDPKITLDAMGGMRLKYYLPEFSNDYKFEFAMNCFSDNNTGVFDTYKIFYGTGSRLNFSDTIFVSPDNCKKIEHKHFFDKSINKVFIDDYIGGDYSAATSQEPTFTVYKNPFKKTYYYKIYGDTDYWTYFEYFDEQSENLLLFSPLIKPNNNQVSYINYYKTDSLFSFTRDSSSILIYDGYPVFRSICYNGSDFVYLWQGKGVSFEKPGFFQDLYGFSKQANISLKLKDANDEIVDSTIIDNISYQFYTKDITPGYYELELEYDSTIVFNNHSGKAKITLKFNTTQGDINPPYIKSLSIATNDSIRDYFMLNDTITIKSNIGDNPYPDSVKMYYKNICSDNWIPLETVGSEDLYISSFIADSLGYYSVKMEAKDSYDNILIYDIEPAFAVSVLPPNLIFPENLTFQPLANYFIWESTPNTLNYTIQICKNELFLNNVIDLIVSDTIFYLLDDLNYNTQYFWRVKSNADVISSSWSAVRSFYTISNPATPQYSAYSWGTNSFWQLGDSSIIQRNTPAQIGTDTAFYSVVCGENHAISIKSDGTLFVWGANDKAQLGLGHREGPTSITRNGIGNNWLKLACRHNHTIAIKSDSTLWEWGNTNIWNFDYGCYQEGPDILSPRQIGTDNDWVDIATWDYHSLALKRDSSLWAFGYNTRGQLGDPNYNETKIPIPIGENDKWIAISCGESHSLAIKSDGTLWAWGDNTYEQLGDGTNENKPVPVQIGTDSDWEVISCGKYNNLAIKTDSTLWAWGPNWYYHLGDGTGENRNYPVQIGTDSDWEVISCGIFNSFCIKTDGTLWAWGQGILGNENEGCVWVPTQIGNQRNYYTVSAGENFTIALRKNVNSLDKPVAITPADSSLDVCINPVFTWSTVDYATEYTFQLSADSSFEAIIISQTLSDTFYSINEELDYNKQYFWRVRASFEAVNSDWSETSRFKTLINLYYGLVAYYPFNANSNDESGNENHGTVFGSVLTEDRFGNNNSAYFFDGLGDYILISNTLLPDTFSSYSISYWMESDMNSTGSIISDRFTNGLAYKYYSNINSDGFGKISAESYNGDSISNSLSSIQGDLNDGEWHFITIVMDADSLTYKVYVDGALDNYISKINPEGWSSLYNPTSIGVRQGPGDNSFTEHFNGGIDDLRIYNRVLAEEEILVLFNYTPLIAPLLTSPSDNELNVRINATLEWEEVINATSYFIQVSTSESFEELLIDQSGIEETCYQLQGSSLNTLYYWRVRATDGEIIANWSEIWSFKTTASSDVNNTIWAWGNNSGQLGDNTYIGKNSPIQIGTDTIWKAIAAGGFFTLAINYEGHLYAWGDNWAGQLGDGSNETKNVPVRIGADSNWLSIDCGADHSAAIKADGTLWTWGCNYDGQLGDSTAFFHNLPTQVGSDSNWISVACGYYHTAAIKTDGTLWTWGMVSSFPIQVGEDNDWAQVSCGVYYTLAIKTDGTLWAWGRNSVGQLGDGTNTSKEYPVQVGTDNDWKAVSCYQHTIAIKIDGTLWGWGINYYYQLGDGTDICKNSPVQIGIDSNWESASCGSYHTVAKKTNNTLWSWGANPDGQLGNGSYDWKIYPEQIKSPLLFKTVYCGWGHTVALASEISIYPTTLLSPFDNETNVSINTTLEWLEVENANTYALQVSTNEDFTNFAINESGIEATEYLLSGLEHNTTYYWRVNVTKGDFTSDWSEVWSFTTCQLPTATISGATAICVGESVELSVELFGIAPFSLEFSDGFIANGIETTIYIREVSPEETTEYSIANVTDANCSNTGEGTATITVNALPTATISGTTSICFGESAELSVELTGTAPFTVEFSDGFLIKGIETTTYLREVNPAATTEYSIVEVTDINCSNAGDGTATITVNALPIATISGTTDICFGESAELSVELTGTAPFTVEFSDGFIANNIVTTTYLREVSPETTTEYSIVEVTDANCSNTGDGTATITVNALPTATISGTTSICFGESAELSVELTGTAPFTVEFNDGFIANNIQNSPYLREVSPEITTEYSIIEVADANCSNTGDGIATITVNPLPTATLSGTTSICFGESAELSVELTGTAPFTVEFNDGFLIKGIETTTYLREVNPAATTEYSIVEVTDANCSNTGEGTATITVNALPTAMISGTTSICIGENAELSVELTGTAPFELEFSDGFIANEITESPYLRNVSPETTTEYSIVEVTDANCSNTGEGTATITVNALPTATISGTTSICFGESAELSVELTGTAPFTVEFNDGFIESDIAESPYIRNVSPETTTEYSIVEVTDANCSNTGEGTATITVNALPTATISGATTICIGESAELSVELTGMAPFTVEFSDGFIANGIETTIYIREVSPEETTEYSIANVTDANCSNTGEGTATITVNALPTATISGTTSICIGENAELSVELTGTAPFELEFSDGFIANDIETTTYLREVSPEETTEYSIANVTDENCSNTGKGTATITVNALPTATITGTTAICAGESAELSVELTGTAPFTVEFSDGFIESDIAESPYLRNVSPETTTEYSIIEVTDANCSNTGDGTAIITVYPLPTLFNVTGGGSYYEGQDGVEIGLDGSETGVDYELFVNDETTEIILNGTGDSLNFGKQTTEGIYTVKATLVEGYCSSAMLGNAEIIIIPLAHQDIEISSGWNIISSYINPKHPDMFDVFEDVTNNINVVKNGAGQMFIPQQEFNNIGDWNIAHGYLANANIVLALTVEGVHIVPEETPLSLNGGWNLVSYLRNSAMNPALALASVENTMLLCKNNEGGIYYPSFGVNTLGNMLPGQGYWIHTNQSGVLTYPENSAGKIIADIELTPLAKQLVPIYKNTGNNATLILKLDGIENGAEVGVYNVNDELIGSGAVHNGVAAVTIWGDDEITKQVDGAVHSELLSVKLLNSISSLNNLSLYNIKEITGNTELNNLTYKTNAIYLAKATVQTNDELAFSINCVPNPAANSTTFEFSLADDNNAEIVVYSLRGDEIAKLRLDGYSAGMHRVVFNTDDLANGSYNVVLRSGTNYTSTIMMIVK